MQERCIERTYGELWQVQEQSGLINKATLREMRISCEQVQNSTVLYSTSILDSFRSYQSSVINKQSNLHSLIVSLYFYYHIIRSLMTSSIVEKYQDVTSEKRTVATIPTQTSFLLSCHRFHSLDSKKFGAHNLQKRLPEKIKQRNQIIMLTLSTLANNLHYNVAKYDENKKKKKGLQFPWKMHSLLDYAEKSGKESIIAWMPNGRSFLIHDQKAFAEELMPIFFSTTKFKSFQRTSNLLGFSAVVGGTDSGCRFHKYFVKGRPDLCVLMKRITVKKNMPIVENTNNGTLIIQKTNDKTISGVNTEDVSSLSSQEDFEERRASSTSGTTTSIILQPPPGDAALTGATMVALDNRRSTHMLSTAFSSNGGMTRLAGMARMAADHPTLVYATGQPRRDTASVISPLLREETLRRTLLPVR